MSITAPALIFSFIVINVIMDESKLMVDFHATEWAVRDEVRVGGLGK